MIVGKISIPESSSSCRPLFCRRESGRAAVFQRGGAAFQRLGTDVQDASREIQRGLTAGGDGASSSANAENDRVFHKSLPFDLDKIDV